MADPATWVKEPHTDAKHRILEAYLNAWYPILSSRQNRLVYIDGFAGPGVYVKGEDGSPIIALRCLLEHSHDLCKPPKEFVFIFVEKDAERSKILGETIKERFPELPESVKVGIYSVDFKTAMDSLLAALDKEEKRLAPTFAFIDPFGYSGLPFYLIQRILGFRSCEVFINFAYNSINRFLETEDNREETFDALFGTTEWRKIRDIKDKEERNRQLIALYSSQLKTSAKYVRSFEMIDNLGRVSYHLFFATNHKAGFRQMKSAMWSVDQRGSFRFADTTDAGQRFLISYEETKFRDQADTLYNRFAGHTLLLQQLEDYCIEETAFPYLWKGSLKILEDEGKLTVTTPRKRKGIFPPGCVICFNK